MSDKPQDNIQTSADKFASRSVSILTQKYRLYMVFTRNQWYLWPAHLWIHKYITNILHGIVDPQQQIIVQIK